MIQRARSIASDRQNGRRGDPEGVTAEQADAGTDREPGENVRGGGSTRNLVWHDKVWHDKSEATHVPKSSRRAARPSLYEYETEPSHRPRSQALLSRA